MAARTARPRGLPERLAAAALVLALAGAAVAADEPAPTWAADREHPGARLPPAGQSLFDAEFGRAAADGMQYELPFPFERLLAKLVDRAGDGVRAVLVPIGRSLQRSAAHPDYFESPRVVVAVVGDAATASATAGLPINDRLFLGYQARAAIIEVISYNEAAGRFEFQVVEDYRAGAEPRVTQPERSTCAACHQGLAPIFSRPLWDETNANADVARRLADVAPTFHGVPVSVGIDVPAAIDAATDRANRLAAYQRVWTDGCGSDSAAAVRCRADLMLEALRYRLAGSRHWRGEESRRGAVLQTLGQRWDDVWPGGLALTNPDIPNRRLELYEPVRGPLDLPGALQDAKPLSREATAAVAAVPERLEPFLPRPPLGVWTAADIGAPIGDEIISGIASFVSMDDLSALDRLLVSGGGVAAEWRVACELRPIDAGAGREDGNGGRGKDGLSAGRLRIVCGGSEPALPSLDLSLSLTATGNSPPVLAGSGTLQRLSLPAAGEVRGRPVRLAPDPAGSGSLLSSATTAPLRAANGYALRLNFVGPPLAPSLEIALVDDFAMLTAALDALATATVAGASDALSDKPLRGSVVLDQLLDRLARAACCASNE